MKVLFVFTPEDGHVKPLLPLITSLVTRGDRAAVAAAGDAARRDGWFRRRVLSNGPR
jgi:UDP:flavonoid glycosyltransferase YjiC (YdhE family)